MASYEKYTLMVGEAGSQRLKILNQVRNPHTMSFIRNLGDLSGKRILDLGCGIGVLSCEFAKEVGDSGEVVAADISCEQIKIAKNNAHRLGIENINFVEVGAHEIDKLDGEFDVIYCRFLLAHVANPLQIINKMLNLLKSGGALFLEEPTSYNVTYSDSYASSFEAWKSLALKQHSIFDTDFSIGQKLYTILNDCGLKNINFNLVQPFFKSKEEKDTLWLGLQESIPSYVSNNLATENELLEVVDGLKSFAQDDKFVVASLQYLQIIGTKN